MQYAMQLATCPPDQDGPVFMINFMKYRELADIGAVLAFAGDVVEAEQSTGWDRIGIVQYPSRKSFIDMQSRTDFREKHTHKETGMEGTIMGDGRAWTEVRITWCDAAAAAADPVDDRERVVVTPRIDRLAQLITAAHPSGSEA